MSVKHSSNSLLFLSIVVLVIGVSTITHGGNATDSKPYVVLRQVVGDDPRSTKGAAFAFLADLPAAELLQAAEQASVERDTVILFGYTGREIIHRLRVCELGLRMLLDELERVQAENAYYSYFLLWVLNSSPHVFSADEQRSVFDLSKLYVSMDKSPLFQERLVAIVTANSMLEELVAQEGADASAVEEYGAQLLTLATDVSEVPEIRRAAIKGISEIEYRQAIPELLMLVQDECTQSILPVARSVCLTLARFGVTEAIPPIQHIMETTQDEYIFGSAAIALADIGGSNALRILVDNAGLMQGGYAGVAIQKLDTLVFELLLTSDEDALSYAIRATEYLHKEDQVSRYKSVLKEMLFSTESKNLIRLILARLQQLVSHAEAGEITDKIPFDTEYSGQWEWMVRFSRAVPATPVLTNVLTEEAGLEKGLKGINGWEYGDAGYRENDIPFMESRGHAGLMVGMNTSNSLRILEVGKSDDATGVEDNSWYDMVDDPDFWCVSTLSNTSMTFARRRDVVGTAVILATYDIGYPWFPTPDLLRYYSGPGTRISPHEVSDLRCDGLVEYCYEYNGLSVWGRYSSHYDVSRTEWVSEHNDFYDWPWNSCEETSPDVQCGRSTDGGICTYMTQSASGDVPTYSTSYSAGCSTVDLYVTATDQSGIHYTGARKSDGDWVYSPVQPQHPNSASYTAHFSFSLSSSGWIYYFAMDNAGNYPVYAEAIYVELETPPLPSYVSPSDGAVNQAQPVHLDWGNVSGADQYQVNVDNNSNFDSSEKDTVTSLTYYDVSGLADRTRYWWRVRAHNSCGWGIWNNGTWDFTTDDPSSVEDIYSRELPKCFVLSQNYPNPFNPETQIEFDLPHASAVSIDVYNIVGRHIRRLANEWLSAGRKAVTWDGCDDRGQRVSSGVYFYRIVADDFTDSKKMVLLK